MSSDNLNPISSCPCMNRDTEKCIFTNKKHKRRPTETKSSGKDCIECKEDEKTCSNTSIKSNSPPSEVTNQISNQAPCQSGLQPDGTIVECICDPCDTDMSNEDNIETLCQCDDGGLENYLQEQENNLFGNTEVVATTNREIVLPDDKVLISQIIRNKTKYKYKKGIGNIDHMEWVTTKFKVNDSTSVPCKHTKSDNLLSKNRSKCNKCSQLENPGSNPKTNLQTKQCQNVSRTTSNRTINNEEPTNAKTKDSCKKTNDNHSLNNKGTYESCNKLTSKESKEKSTVEPLDSKSKVMVPENKDKCKICSQPMNDGIKTIYNEDVQKTSNESNKNFNALNNKTSNEINIPVANNNYVCIKCLQKQDQINSLNNICMKCSQILNRNKNEDTLLGSNQKNLLQNSIFVCKKCKQATTDSKNGEPLNNICAKCLQPELKEKSLKSLSNKDICVKCAMQKSNNEKHYNPTADYKDLCKNCLKKVNENHAQPINKTKYCKKCSLPVSSQTSLHSNNEYLCKKCNQTINNDKAEKVKNAQLNLCKKCNQPVSRQTSEQSNNNIYQRCNQTISKENGEKYKNAQPVNKTKYCKKCSQPVSSQTSLHSNNEYLCKKCNQTKNNDKDEKFKNAQLKLCEKCMQPVSRQTSANSQDNINCKRCNQTINKNHDEKEKRAQPKEITNICEKCALPLSRPASLQSSNMDICSTCNQTINKGNTDNSTDEKIIKSSSGSLNPTRRLCGKCSRQLDEALNSKPVKPTNSRNLCEKPSQSLKKSLQEKPSLVNNKGVCAKCSQPINENYNDKQNTNNNDELCHKCKQPLNKRQTKSTVPAKSKHLCSKCSQLLGEDSSNTPSQTKNKIDKCEKCSQLLNNKKKCEKCVTEIPAKQKSFFSVKESFESAKSCMGKKTREVNSEYCTGIENVTEMGPKRSCVTNSDTSIQSDSINIDNTSDFDYFRSMSNGNKTNSSGNNVCVPLKDSIYKSADCVANMQEELLKLNYLGVTSSTQPDKCTDCDESQAKPSAKYEIFRRILDAYKACSCKLCNCVTSQVNAFKQGNKDCDCKPCECPNCELMKKNKEKEDEYQDASNKSTTCKCNPCECIACKNNVTAESKKCSCKPCECDRCEHGNKSQNYTIAHTVLLAVGEQNHMRNPCKCSPCECINCQSRSSVVQPASRATSAVQPASRTTSAVQPASYPTTLVRPALMTNEMSTCIAVHPNCHCDLATCPQTTCLPDDNPVCRCVRSSRVMQKPTTPQNQREFDVHIASVANNKYDRANNHKLNTFKKLLAENEDFDRNYPEKNEYSKFKPVRPFVYTGHRIDSIFAMPRNINRFEESYLSHLRSNSQDFDSEYLRNLPSPQQLLINESYGYDNLNMNKSSNPRFPILQRLSYNNNKRSEKYINSKCNKKDFIPRYYKRKRNIIRPNEAIVNSMFGVNRTIDGSTENKSSNMITSSISNHTTESTSTFKPTFKRYSFMAINACPPAESLIAEYELCEPEISNKLRKKPIESTHHITQESIDYSIPETNNQAELSEKFNKSICDMKACNARLENTIREAKYFTEKMSSMLRKFEQLNQEIHNIASQLLSIRHRF